MQPDRPSHNSWWWRGVLLAPMLLALATGCQQEKLNKEASLGLASYPYPTPPENLAPSLRILVWPDTIIPAVAESFTKRYGVKLEIDTFVNDDEAYEDAVKYPSKWQLIMLSQYMADRMRRENMLMPVPKINQYIYQYIDPSLLNQQADPQMKFFIPFDYAVLGVTFNVDYMAGFPRKWRFLSEQQQNPYVYGRVVMNDDMRFALTVAMLYAGHDPAHATRQDIADARDLLIQNVKEFGLRFLSDSKIRAEMQRSEALMGITWSGEAAAILKAKPACRFLIPEGKAIVNLDGFCIPKGASNPQTAALFIEYMLHPYNSLLVANDSMYSSVNVRSMKSADRFLVTGPSTMLPLPKDLIHMKFLNGEELKTYEEAWAEVKKATPDTNRITLLPLQ